ncbi:MAG TPA: hypothetical protein VFJ18_12230 [Pararhizobium sp.]|nr:hypothetical protein [Pararhizobium sp.]
MSDPTMIRIYEQTLTDGSKVYGVVAGAATFDCVNENEAYELANTIDHLSLNTQFDGWDRIQRAA